MHLVVEEVDEVVAEGVGEDRTGEGKGEGNDLLITCDTGCSTQICCYSEGQSCHIYCVQKILHTAWLHAVVVCWRD